VPAGEARLAVRWRKQGRNLILETDVPEGWSVSVENRTGCDLVWRQRGARQLRCLAPRIQKPEFRSQN
jgi:hypothetical protein